MGRFYPNTVISLVDSFVVNVLAAGTQLAVSHWKTIWFYFYGFS